MSEEMEFDEDHMLAAEFALGLLSGAELTEARRRVAEDPGFAAQVARWDVQLSELAEDVPAEAVPPRLKKDLDARLFGVEDGFVRRILLRPLIFWRGLSAAMLLLVAVLGFLLLETPEPAPLRVAEIASPDGSFRYLAVLDTTEDVLQVTRVSGTAPPGRVLQVWAHGDDQPAISVGLFGDGETARLPLPPELRNVEGTFTMGISEEPPGGSLLDGPSGQVLGNGEIRGL